MSASRNAPTAKQYRYLLSLASGSALVCGRKRETEMYLRRGWVTAEKKDDGFYPYAWVRITPDGLHAVALGAEKYGLPDLGPKAHTTYPVCTKCGGTSFRYESKEHDVPASVRTAA